MDIPDLRRRIEQGERLGFRAAARVVFLAGFAAIVAVAVAAQSFLIALLAAAIAGFFIRAALPEERFRTWLRGYWTGRAGDRWRRRYESLKTWGGRWL